MSESFTLEGPAQINAWVLLSRISQCHLHMDGIKVPGLLKWLKANVPDCATARTVKDAYCGLLDYCDEFGLSAPGGERCHYRILVSAKGGSYYQDSGIYATMEEAANLFGALYAAGRVVVLRTMEQPRLGDPTKVMEFIR